MTRELEDICRSRVVFNGKLNVDALPELSFRAEVYGNDDNLVDSNLARPPGRPQQTFSLERVRIPTGWVTAADVSISYEDVERRDGF